MIAASFDLFITVSDDEDIDAMRLFYRNGIFAGESGAASLAGLVCAAVDHGALRQKLARSRVVLLSTEGITDPDFYSKQIGPIPNSL